MSTENKCKTCGCIGGNGTWLTTWRDGSPRSTEACPDCHDCTTRCLQCLLGGRLAANKCSVAGKHKHKDCVCLEHRPARATNRSSARLDDEPPRCDICGLNPDVCTCEGGQS